MKINALNSNAYLTFLLTRIALLSALLCSAPAIFASTTPHYLPEVTDFRSLAKEARQKQIPIVVLFMSESCHFCEVVLSDFLVPMYMDPEYDNKVILRQVEITSHDLLIDFDGSMTTHSKYASRLQVWGVPQVYFFDSHGHILNKIAGLLTQDYYGVYLDEAIDAAIAQIRNSRK